MEYKSITLKNSTDLAKFDRIYKPTQLTQDNTHSQKYLPQKYNQLVSRKVVIFKNDKVPLTLNLKEFAESLISRARYRMTFLFRKLDQKKLTHQIQDFTIFRKPSLSEILTIVIASLAQINQEGIG
jgi:hypothetical protein